MGPILDIGLPIPCKNDRSFLTTPRFSTAFRSASSAATEVSVRDGNGSLRPNLEVLSTDVQPARIRHVVGTSTAIILLPNGCLGPLPGAHSEPEKRQDRNAWIMDRQVCERKRSLHRMARLQRDSNQECRGRSTKAVRLWEKPWDCN